MSTLKVRKWGNSLAIRLPKSLAERHQLLDGSEIKYRDSSKRTVLEFDEPNLTLEELVNAITPENRHTATDWGSPLGNEIW
jgi:antitoxin MazE